MDVIAEPDYLDATTVGYSMIWLNLRPLIHSITILPQKSPPIDPKLKQSIEDCAKDMYSVTAKGAGFTPSTKGTPGSFNGSRIDEKGIEQEVNVVNENRAYDGWQIGAKAHAGQWVAGVTINDTSIRIHSDGRVELVPSGYSPYRNFVARDLREVAPFISWVGAQVWELGNSLSYITDKGPAPYLDPNRNNNDEPGLLFTDCVRRKYGGHYGEPRVR
jgi:hypothetical protein